MPNPDLEYKNCFGAEFKLSEEGAGSFAGYGSVYGNKDRDEEVIDPEAVVNLESFLKDGFGAVGHNWGALPIATIDAAKQDGQGLHISAGYHSTQDAQDARTVVRERLERGKSVGLSIGFKTLKDDRKDGIRHLQQIELYEVSIVTRPANPLAGVSVAKGFLGDGMPFRDRSRALVAASREHLECIIRRREMREKDGRKLSEQDVAEWDELIQLHADLLAEMKAQRLPTDLETLLALEYERARFNGVPL